MAAGPRPPRRDRRVAERWRGLGGLGRSAGQRPRPDPRGLMRGQARAGTAAAASVRTAAGAAREGKPQL